jgi:hypothetical protein
MTSTYASEGYAMSLTLSVDAKLIAGWWLVSADELNVKERELFHWRLT